MAPKDLSHIYEPLAPSSIRVLTLFPGNAEDEIHCNLSTHDINSSPKYEAISYVWGDPLQIKMVYLNGQAVPVRKNIYDCLHHMRYEKYGQCRTLWVDALCINQEDIGERGHQVALMPRVYSSATRTLLWLSVDKTWQRRDTLNSNGAITESLSDALVLLDKHVAHEHINPDRLQHQARAIYRLYRAGWWKRMWVVQETLLSPSAHIYVGKVSIPWERALSAIRNFLLHSTSCCHPPKSVRALLDVYMQIVPSITYSFQKLPNGIPNEVIAYLWMFRDREASIAHDKVYAILGLLSYTPTSFTPDYEQPFASVCRSIVLEDIRRSRNLHALKGTQKEQRPGEPSWVIDWNDDTYMRSEKTRILAEISQGFYSASGGSLPRIRTFRDENSLGVEGQIFDDVINSFKPSRYSKLVSFGSQDFVWRMFFDDKSYVHNVSFDLTRYVAGGSPIAALWKTMLGGRIYSEKREVNSHSNPQIVGMGNSVIRRARLVDLIPFMLWWLCHQVHYGEHEFVESMHRIRAVQAINDSFNKSCTGRRLFLTAKGYIGLGPDHIAAGDKVAILLGGSTPFIIRTVDDATSESEARYKLIGDCYVHGVMDGELVKDCSPDDWPTLVLVLV